MRSDCGRLQRSIDLMAILGGSISVQLWRFPFLLLLVLALSQLRSVLSLNEEGQLLLEWKKLMNDTKNSLGDWNAADSTPCRWTGVSCTQGSVTGINLHNYLNLTGPLPQDVFGKFTNLTDLDVGNSNLGGVFPQDIVNCSKLVNLDLSFSYIGGEMPQDISNLALLQNLNLSYAYFNGTIPDSIGQLQELKYLSLLSNYFVGSIPDTIVDLPKLQILTLTGNMGLSGEIPSGIFKMQTLIQLQLGQANFTPAPMPSLDALVNMEVLYFLDANFTQGPFPTAVKEMAQLVELKLTSCNITGPIPQYLENLTHLEIIWLDENSLTGSIPDIFGDLRNLTDFSVENNQLSGTLPASIWRSSQLGLLTLYNNLLEGEITEIGNLRNLYYLELSSNKFTGAIPAALGNLTKLVTCNLSMNNFSGQIPPGIVDWEDLVSFRMFANQVTGMIPYTLGSKSFLENVDFSNNFLEGPIPPDLCRGNVLKFMRMSSNQLTGAVPNTYENCTNLIRVSLFNNFLEGPIPAAMWGGTQTTSLLLYNNSFNGSISENIGSATKLGLLEIYQNEFSGSIPAGIGNTILGKFLADSNKFSGPIPSQLGSLTNLTQIYLSSNSLSGSIPAALSGCTQLVQLDLHNNHLTGSIPDELANLENLNSLDLSQNDLTGTIPSSLLNQVQLQTLNLAYNNLSGIVPASDNSGYTKVNVTGNPYICETNSACGTNATQNLHSTDKIKKIGWVVGVTFAATAFVLCAGSFMFMKRYKKILEGLLQPTKASSDNSWILTSFQVREFQDFEVTDLDEDNLIGSGGSGKVYKATLEDGASVAVKKLWGVKKIGKNHDHGFKAEVKTLGNIRHRNIVKLLCSCSKKDSNLLVYEYMPNGSLGDLLHNTKGNNLTWDIRYKIALGAATGLEYLHHDCTPQILHRDVKSNNILLDTDYEAHLADFGIAKIVEPAATQDSSTIAGSLGYIAPEYAYSLKVDEKSDIYSFGVVLLELVTGKRAVEPLLFGEDVDLVQWIANKMQTKEGLYELLDKTCGEEAQEDMIVLLKIGILCTSFMPMSRPSMREVVMMMKMAKPKYGQTAKAKVNKGFMEEPFFNYNRIQISIHK